MLGRGVGARRLLDLRQPAAALRRALGEARRHRQAERPAVDGGPRRARPRRSRPRTSACGATTPRTAARLDAKAVDGVMQREVRARARPLALRRPGPAGHAASTATTCRSTATRSSRGGPSPPRSSRAEAPVALLGAEAAATFFPTGDVVGQTIRVGDIPVVGRRHVRGEGLPLPRQRGQPVRLAQPRRRACRRRSSRGGCRATAGSASTASTFRIPDLKVMKTFSEDLESLLRGNHRLQDDFRIDDIAARVRKRQEPGRRLQHHLHALGRPVAHRRRHGQRQHPAGDAQGARARGRASRWRSAPPAARSSRAS